jgi:multidrug efflux system outer membrane protein
MSEVERIGVAQAGRLPVVSLSGVAGFANPALSGLFSNDAFSASLTEGLLGPIFAFGQNKRRVSLQQKEAETAALNYQQTFIRSIREVEDALSSVATYTDELSARERQTDAAAKVVNLSQARYDSGMTSYLELLDAQRTLFSSQLLLSSTRRQLLVSYIDLYRALGGGW